MKTWLKLIGSAESPITEWKKPYVGFRKKNKPGIRMGDRLFLYAPGSNNRRIFALAVAVSDPERVSDDNPNLKGSCQWNVGVRYEINHPVTSGILIGDVSSHRNLTMSLRQQSHIKLHPEESESANSKLRDAKQ